MNLLADESVEQQIVERLRHAGHDVVAVCERSPGIDDDEVLDAAVRDSRVLLTADKDFGELVFRLGRASAGVILVRLTGMPNALKGELVAEALHDHLPVIPGAFTVIEAGRVRVRRP